MERNTLKVNPDLYLTDRLSKTSTAFVTPAINLSPSQFLTSNISGEISANKSNQEQNILGQSYNTNSQVQKSPSNTQKFLNENLNAKQNKNSKESMTFSKQAIIATTKSPNPIQLSANNGQGQTYSKFKGFFISIYIRKFVTILKQSSSILRFKQLALQQFNIISDQASDYYYYYFSNHLNQHVS